jgi:hypothetical protein
MKCGCGIVTMKISLKCSDLMRMTGTIWIMSLTNSQHNRNQSHCENVFILQVIYMLR